jgi:hypothetical protein
VQRPKSNYVTKVEKIYMTDFFFIVNFSVTAILYKINKLTCMLIVPVIIIKCLISVYNCNHHKLYIDMSKI